MARRILHEIKLDKIAAVDRPCQEGATMAIMKRDGAATDDDGAEAIWLMTKGLHPEEVAKLSEAHLAEAREVLKRDFTDKERQAAADKGAAMPDGSYPILNTSDLKNALRAIGRAKDPAATKRHIITRARALGAIDQLPGDWKVSKREGAEGDDDMSEDLAKLQKSLEELTGKFTELSAANAVLAKRADLTDAEKAFTKGMKADEEAEFLKLDAAGRKAAMEKAASAEEVYTTQSGMVIRKGAVGEGVFAILKSQDEQLRLNAEALKVEKAARADAEIAKRAETEFAHVSGPLATKVLKAAAALPETQREGIVELLKAANDLAKAGFKTMGAKPKAGDDEPDADDPMAKLEKMANDMVKADPKLSYAKAFDKACQTPEGQQHYKAYKDAKPAGATAH